MAQKRIVVVMSSQNSSMDNDQVSQVLDETAQSLQKLAKTLAESSDRTKPWFRFGFCQNPKVSVSTETHFQQKPKPKPNFLGIFALFYRYERKIGDYFVEKKFHVILKF